MFVIVNIQRMFLAEIVVLFMTYLQPQFYMPSSYGPLSYLLQTKNYHRFRAAAISSFCILQLPLKKNCVFFLLRHKISDPTINDANVAPTHKFGRQPYWYC